MWERCPPDGPLLGWRVRSVAGVGRLRADPPSDRPRDRQPEGGPVPEHRPDATAQLTALLGERIMVLDGAMGTVIQRDRPDEAGYRGERFADWPERPAGQQRPAHASPSPTIIAAIHRDYLDAGADIIETNTFNANADLPGRLRPGGARLRAQPRGGRAGAREAATRSPRDPPTGRASSPARSARRPAPRRSRPTSTTPAPATSPSTSWSRPTSSRPAAWSTAAPTC